MVPAGYGINNAAWNSDIVTLSGAALADGTLSGTSAASGATGNAIVWRQNTTGVSQCFAAIGNAAGGLTLAGPVNCSTATEWSSKTWSKRTLASTGSYTFIATLSAGANCSQYGKTTEGKVTVEIKTLNSNQSPASLTLCLPNITA
jgi:hypothetical protein